MAFPQNTQAASASPGRPALAGGRQWLFALLWVSLASTAVVSPMLFLGTASGHDLQFHLASWIDVLGQWHEGVIYPRWAEWANWGFGEPRFIFYPPASWMAGAALGALLPWRMVPGVYIWLTLIVAGMSMWKLTREWLPGSWPVVAAVLFAVNPYHLVTAYYRSDFAELLAGALMPLLFWAVLRVASGEGRRVPLFAVIFAGIWLANAPEGVIATYSLALVLLAACIGQPSARPLLLGGAAMAGGFALAAFYIVPAAYEQRWVQIAQAVGDNLRPAENFLFTRVGDLDFIAFNHRVSWVAVALMGCTAAAALPAWRARQTFPELWRTLGTLGVAAAFLMLPLSLPLWRFLPKLAFMQFPWRWLEILAIAFAFFAAAACAHARREWLARGAVALVLAATVIAARAMVKTAWWDSQNAPVLLDEVHSGRGYEGTDEYMPLGCDRSELPGNPDDTTRADDASETPELPVEQVDADNDAIVPVHDALVQLEIWPGERRSFRISEAEPAVLALRLVNYPAWEARIDGTPAAMHVRPPITQLLLPVPAGPHQVTLQFRRTWDRTAGDAISCASLLTLAGWLVAMRRKGSVV